jgi:CelD/BcsL family acetyltransferase involved in cellulose biosynthesis
MEKTAAVESFETIGAYASRLGSLRLEPSVFMLPSWMQTWWQAFKPGGKLHLCLIKIGGNLIGVAPRSVSGVTASFVGCADVCDYMDFAVVPGFEKEFYGALLDDLSRRGVAELDLRCVRPESTALSHLVETALNRDGACVIEPDGISLEMELPGDWNEYLNMLTGKQRHEIRRKLRRLREKGEMRFLVMENSAEITETFDAFLKMFRESRPDKAAFMNPQMESFFRSMMRAMSEEGALRLFILKLNGLIAAAALCFDYRDTMYLYNSGFDPRYRSLSVGLLCKILSIEHSIKIRRKKYDFLKGVEPYKHYLGGKEVRLSRCRISFK